MTGRRSRYIWIDGKPMTLLRVLVMASLLGFAGARYGTAAQSGNHASSASESSSLSSSASSSGSGVHEICPRPGVAGAIPEPLDLRSENGALTVDFAFRSDIDAHGRTRYCYIYKDGVESPNLRLHPGDLLVLRLKNELKPTESTASTQVAIQAPTHTANQASGKDTKAFTTKATKVHEGNRDAADRAANAAGDSCVDGKMTMTMDATSTNLHFHGLTVPPVCHQDDVLHTSIQPSDGAFEYRVRIPTDQPPGLYWYHPHIHGLTRAQVVGGASGALIIEGIERVNREVAGLPERVIIIRDEDLLNPGAAPSAIGQTAPPATLDRDGDARNTGDGSGTPTKDLSVNFVSVPYPAYQPGTIRMRPSERQFWRIVNASSITYLNLQLLVAERPQALGVVAVDGAPVNDNGQGGNYVLWQSHLGIPPGGRSEFIVTAPANGETAALITRSVNTGPAGENDPTRPLFGVITSPDALEPVSSLPLLLSLLLPSSSTQPAAASSETATKTSGLPWLGTTTPTRTRKLYFSEQPQNPNDPNSPTNFYLTVEGQTPAVFDSESFQPNIVVHQGDVEDWIIENRSEELHDFHIHQVHFVMLEWFGIAINEPFLRDTVPVPFWDGKTTHYPTVKLRMDFRDPNAIGLFPFHCHLLEHEDGGMMGLIRVDPAVQKNIHH
jgi:FtsP/CotA-like multicopper oxidase with cupredoxin domain